MNIEASFNTERQKILNRNNEEIKNLFQEQKQLEEDFMEQRQQKEEEYNKELETLRTQDANDQAEQKIKLEKEMQILQMVATARLQKRARRLELQP